jgi:trehalose 6-phosphate phosphatase
MNRLLDPAHIGQLAQLAWSRVLLAFDFDGTLAPIVADRDRARMRDLTRGLLEQVCRLYPCVVISGRSRDDVERRVAGIPLRQIIGNHGLEPGDHTRLYEPQISTVRPQLEAALAAHPGVDIEDKRFSLAVHYRKSRRKRDVRLAIHRAVQELTLPMRVIPGKLVVNVIPEHAPHKGDALVRLRAQEGADTALYVGDDVTDEDVFELDQPGRLFSIRVGSSRSSAAAHYLRDQREVDVLLSRLVKLRAEGGGQ